jgi:hypothetical protein
MDTYRQLMFNLANDNTQVVYTGDGTLLANCSTIGCDEWVALRRTLDDLAESGEWEAVRGIVWCHRHSVVVDGPYVHHYGTEMSSCEQCDDLVRSGYWYGKALEGMFEWMACPG